MKLSRTACYAIHAVVFLASQKDDRIVIGHRAAKALGIPKGFFLRILVALSRAQILWSIKGPNGGYRLARPARDITLLEVVEAVEGPLHSSPFSSPGERASRLERRLEAVFDQANETIRRRLQQVRIADLLEKGRGRQ